jgi:hypothetical protein
MKAQHFLQWFIAAFFLNNPFGIAAVSTLQGPPAETLIEGVPCLNNDLKNTFKVHTCILAREHAVSGGLLPAGSHVGFMKGIVLECKLSRDFAIQGHAFKKGEIISLTADGKLNLTAKKLE